MIVDRIAKLALTFLLVDCSSSASTDVEVPTAEVVDATASSSVAQAPRRPRKPRPASSVPPPPEHRATPEERARAEEAFERGRALMDAGRTKEACGSFAESVALEPAVGSEMNLGACLEKLGDVDGACRAFASAVVRAHDQPERRQYLESRRAQLSCNP